MSVGLLFQLFTFLFLLCFALLMADSNIIMNGDFSVGIEPWYPNNGCQAFVVSFHPNSTDSISDTSSYVVVTNRKETSQGLQQDVTNQISPGITYTFGASVSLSCPPSHETDKVVATLRLEHDDDDSPTEYFYSLVGKINASRDKWVDMKGTFSISNMPKRVVLCLEGPSPGKDLLIRSVTVTKESECKVLPPVLNIIKNHDFSDGLRFWKPNSSESLTSVSSDKSNLKPYMLAKNRSQTWQGPEQDITGRVSPGCSYKVSATVGVSGLRQGPSAQVVATLRLKHQNSATKYRRIVEAYASNNTWKILEGSFILSGMPDVVLFFLEGPPPGIDLLVKSVTIHCENDNPLERKVPQVDNHILLNSSFYYGLSHWAGRGSKLMLNESLADGKVLPYSGPCFASATKRTHNWSGIEQDITETVQIKIGYEMSSVVRVSRGNHTVLATLYVHHDNHEEYVGISSVQANHDGWVKLKGNFVVNHSPEKVVVFIQGPIPGIDIYVDHFEVKPEEKKPPLIESHLTDGRVEGWFSRGTTAETEVED